MAFGHPRAVGPSPGWVGSGSPRSRPGGAHTAHSVTRKNLKFDPSPGRHQHMILPGPPLPVTRSRQSRSRGHWANSAGGRPGPAAVLTGRGRVAEPVRVAGGAMRPLSRGRWSGRRGRPQARGPLAAAAPGRCRPWLDHDDRPARLPSGVTWHGAAGSGLSAKPGTTAARRVPGQPGRGPPGPT